MVYLNMPTASSLSLQSKYSLYTFIFTYSPLVMMILIVYLILMYLNMNLTIKWPCMAQFL